VPTACGCGLGTGPAARLLPLCLSFTAMQVTEATGSAGSKISMVSAAVFSYWIIAAMVRVREHRQKRGLYQDAEAAANWLKGQGRRQLVYTGESMGCGVAVELATRQPAAGLILQSGFSSAVDVAGKAYPYLPVRLLMRDKYDSAAKMSKISCPVLVIHGERGTPRIERSNSTGTCTVSPYVNLTRFW